MLEPKSFDCAMAASPSLGHLLRGVLDRLDDVVVAGAAAQIALEEVADLGFARLLLALEELVGSHDHARCAEAALEAVLLPEALLDRVELSVLGEPLDREDVSAVGLNGKHVARLRRSAVDHDRAGAALARVAPDVRPGEIQDVAEVVDE